ncbi:MAG: DMT family transporter [Akkermansiaceae bacterium]
MRIGDILILLFLAGLWGASFLFMRISAPGFGPVPLVALRMTLAGLFLSPVFFRKQAREMARQYWWPLLVSGVVGTSVAFMLLSYASLTLSAGFTSLMNSSVPIFSAIIASIWLGERLRSLQILGLGFAILGVVVLVWGKLNFDDSGTGWAIAACLGACLCYGFGASWMKSRLKGVRPMVASAGSLLGAGLVLIPFALMRLPQEMPSPVSWASAIALALFCTALAFVFFFKLIQRSGATVATSVTFLIPFFAIFWGWLFLDEAVTPQMIAGLVVTLIGTSLITGIVGGRRGRGRKCCPQ